MTGGSAGESYAATSALCRSAAGVPHQPRAGKSWHRVVWDDRQFQVGPSSARCLRAMPTGAKNSRDLGRPILRLAVAVFVAACVVVWSGSLVAWGGEGTVLHKRLEKKMEGFLLLDFRGTPSQLYADDELSFSGKLIDLGTGARTPLARVVLGMSCGVSGTGIGIHESQELWVNSDVDGAVLRKGSPGQLGLSPGKWTISPWYVTLGQDVNCRSASPVVVEVYDRTNLTLGARTENDGTTTVEGRLTTAHGVGVFGPVRIKVDGSPALTVTSGDNGSFAWTKASFRPGPRTITASFPGSDYLDPCSASLTYDSSSRYWDVLLFPPSRRIVIPETTVVVRANVDGDAWPPPPDLRLSLVATGPDKKGGTVAAVGVSAHALIFEAVLPKAPGVYSLTVRPEKEGMDRIRVQPVAVTIWAPLVVSLEVVRGGGGPALEATVTSLGAPVGGIPLSVSRNGNLRAEGRTDAQGRYRVEGSLGLGVYSASVSPGPESFYLPATSRSVGVGLWPPIVATVAFVGSAVVVLTVVRKARVRASMAERAAAEAAASQARPPEEPRVDIRGLPPREQIAELFGTAVATVLAPLVPPNPTRGHWDYWRAVGQTVPGAREPFRGLLRLYLEAAYSRHPVTGEQAEEAWRFSEALAAAAAEWGVSGA